MTAAPVTSASGGSPDRVRQGRIDLRLRELNQLFDSFDPAPFHEKDLDGDAEDAGWQDRALCAQTDPEAFFPEKGGSTREAKKVCLTCDVRGDCLEYALHNDERFGIWGGLSERERRKLKKRAV